MLDPAIPAAFNQTGLLMVAVGPAIMAGIQLLFAPNKPRFVFTSARLTYIVFVVLAIMFNVAILLLAGFGYFEKVWANPTFIVIAAWPLGLGTVVSSYIALRQEEKRLATKYPSRFI